MSKEKYPLAHPSISLPLSWFFPAFFLLYLYGINKFPFSLLHLRLSSLLLRRVPHHLSVRVTHGPCGASWLAEALVRDRSGAGEWAAGSDPRDRDRLSWRVSARDAKMVWRKERQERSCCVFSSLHHTILSSQKWFHFIRYSCHDFNHKITDLNNAVSVIKHLGFNYFSNWITFTFINFISDFTQSTSYAIKSKLSWVINSPQSIRKCSSDISSPSPWLNMQDNMNIHDYAN